MLRPDLEDDLILTPELDDEFAYWPLNLILLILGATIVGLAFSYLNPQDRRWLYNPWTYVVLTPVALLLISVVLSTVVSRVMEKSMQLAFLLSVLVHMLFLIGAMNVVIFSRLWPDILESLAQQRHQLKRQALQANQYHRITSTSQNGSRPDYLRFVPTQHQPTELSTEHSPALSLAMSARENLVSPSPEIEISANPHLLRRRTASPSAPSTLDATADLSRSELRRELNTDFQPEMFDLRSAEEPPKELEPTSAPLSRNATRQADPTPRITSDSPLVIPRIAVDRQLVRTKRSEDSPSLAEVDRDSSELQRYSPSTNAFPSAEVPVLDSVNNVDRDVESLVASRSSNSQRQSSGSALPSAVMRSAPDPAEASHQTLANADGSLQRRQREWAVPQQSLGDFRSALPRTTAGGSTGPAAPSSMPIQGVDSLGAARRAPQELISSTVTPVRRRADGRKAGASLNLGAPQAPSWTKQPSLSAGIAGLSPSNHPQADTGMAIDTDVAGLSGQGRVIERSQTGTLGIPETESISVDPPRLAEQTLQHGLSSDSRINPHNAPLSRQRQAEASRLLELEAEIVGMDESADVQANAALPNIQRRNPSGEPDSPRQYLGPREPLARTGMPGRIEPPQTNSIEVTDSDNSYAQDLDSPESPSSRAEGRRGGQGSPVADLNMVELEAPSGAGGVMASDATAGDLLPRRRDLTQRVGASELEMQRFARQEVGGPLAAGQIALPQPAFRQRLERLRDRDPLEQTTAEPQTELAIERGLAFLAKHQRQDGSWRLQDFDTQVLMTSDTAATGLALLAFQGAGYTHKEFKYADVCGRAIQFLRTHQQSNGDLYIPQDPASDQNAWLYSHAIAAIALCEAYGMTRDEELQPSAQKAVDFILDSQDPLRGGWRYRPGVGSDTSVSGWFMMALKSAELAGLQVSAIAFERLERFLTRSQSVDGQPYLYRYNPYAADTPQQRHGLEPTAVMTSVGLLMRLYTGWRRSQPEMRNGAAFLLEHLPAHGTQEISGRDTYYWYYATQVMFHMGDESWQQWQATLYPLLIENQITQGADEGSWDPLYPTPDLWARYGGRLYVTTMNLLSLEVSYRHLPLYEATAPE